MIAFLIPGQGAQRPGLLAPWLEVPDAARDLASWSDLAGVDLHRLGTEGSSDEIRDTAVAQPLLTVAALLSARALGIAPDIVCGHSVGELAALAIAGVIAPDVAVWLAAERGQAMAAAAGVGSTGMIVVQGADREAVLEAAAEVGLELATINDSRQLVLGGSNKALDAFESQLMPGARAMRLETAAAFHTTAMLPAVPRFRALVQQIVPADPACAVVSNKDGAVIGSGRELLSRLVDQVTQPVRFDLCLSTISGLRPTKIIELAPAGTLGSIAKRALPHVERLAIKVPADAAQRSALVS